MSALRRRGSELTAPVEWVIRARLPDTTAAHGESGRAREQETRDKLIKCTNSEREMTALVDAPECVVCVCVGTMTPDNRITVNFALICQPLRFGRGRNLLDCSKRTPKPERKC